MPAPKRVRLSRVRGWRMPEGAIKVDRSTRLGNPFDFRKSECCWVALSFGCRGDALGRQKASVLAFSAWINPPDGRRTLSSEIQPKMGRGKKWGALGPKITAGEAPKIEDAIAALAGHDLACWCSLCPAHKDGLPFGVNCPDCAPCHADVLLALANGADA